MNRLLALLLLPILVVGNSFAHCCGSSAHSSHGDSRTHIHIGGKSHLAHHHIADGHANSHTHHHHHHSGSDRKCCSHAQRLHVQVPSDHDSDAIYVVISDFASEGMKNRISVRYDQETTTGETLGKLDNGFQSKVVDAHLQDTILRALPLYLLHAVLRL